MPVSQHTKTDATSWPAAFCRQLAMLLGACWLVWLLAFTLAPSGGAAPVAQPADASGWQQAPAELAPILLLAQNERASAQLFLHPKQQPLYVLVAEPVLLLLRQLALLLPVVLILAWFIRAGPRRSFRLALWRDANLCCKRQLCH